MFIFLKDFIYLSLERGGRRDKERQRNINVWLPLARPLQGTQPATQACVLTGNGTKDPLICRLELNPLSHTIQGLIMFVLKGKYHLKGKYLSNFSFFIISSQYCSAF